MFQQIHENDDPYFYFLQSFFHVVSKVDIYRHSVIIQIVNLGRQTTIILSSYQIQIKIQISNFCEKMFFTLFIMIVTLGHADDYLLSLHMQQQLNVTDGMQLDQLIVYANQIYAMVTNETHFQLIRYHWPDDFSRSDQGPAFQAYIQPGQSNLNPELSYSSGLIVIYREVNQTGTRVLKVTQSDLNSFSRYSFNESFTAQYVPSMRSYYLKYEDGKEEAIRYFPSSDTISFENGNITYEQNTIEDYLILVSKNSKYVITINKPTGFLLINQFRYNWDGTVNSSKTSELEVNAFIFCASFYQEYHLYLLSNNSCIYDINLAELSVTCYNIVYNYTNQCYFEKTTQSIITMKIQNGMIALSQVSLFSNSSQQYTFNATKVLHNGQYMIYLGNEDSFISFSTTSCPTNFNYLPGQLRCENCQTGCDSCNGSIYCNSCSNRYINSTYGSTYAQLYQYCDPCPSNCENCSSSSVCINCDPNYQLTSNYKCQLIPQPQQSESSIIALSGLEQILNALTTITGLTDVIPSARSMLRPVLYILISFDDFFPYMFHERYYGKTIQSLFKSIHDSQTQKWSTYDNYFIDPVLNSIGVDKDNFTSSLDHYYNYSSPVFIAREDNGQSVLISIFSFITTNFIVSTLLFIIFRVFFKILFQFRISLIFRPQSFWPFLAFFIMEGNLQVVTFYASSILRINFFLTPIVKFQAALVYTILFFLIFFAVSAYFLVYQKLGSLTKYFAENVNSSFRSIAFLTIECGIKNLLFALVHSLLRAPDLYKLQFTCLIAIEIMCLMNYFLFLKIKKFFEVRGRSWIMMILGMTRISFIVIIFVQQNSYNDEVALEGLNSAVETVLTIYFFTIFIGFIHNILLALIDLGVFIKNCITRPRAPTKKDSPPSVKNLNEDPQKQAESYMKERIQNQKQMMRVYFANKPITVKSAKKRNPNLLKITTLDKVAKKAKET